MRVRVRVRVRVRGRVRVRVRVRVRANPNSNPNPRPLGAVVRAARVTAERVAVGCQSNGWRPDVRMSKN